MINTAAPFVETPSQGPDNRTRTATSCLALVSVLAVAGLVFNSAAWGQAGEPASLPLLTIADLEYKGAFRLPWQTFGESSAPYNEGPIEYNPDNDSIFIVGHSHQNAIGEFVIPEIVNSNDLNRLNYTGNPIQNFRRILDNVSGGNPDGVGRISGLKYLRGPDGPELLVNAYAYYTNAGSPDTTVAVRNATNLSSSPVTGFYEMQDRNRAAGWMSEVPAEWRSLLGGSYITGHSSAPPIVTRTTVGPSAFIFNPFDVVGNNSPPKTIPTRPLLDFPYAANGSTTLPADFGSSIDDALANKSGTNNLWTWLSGVGYGFIVPGTRTYLTIGWSGGHGPGGVCYKCTNDKGQTSGGWGTADSSDNYPYYWLWDVNDFVDVKNGRKSPWQLRPYEYGKFDLPSVFQGFQIKGGAYDAASGRLFLAVVYGAGDMPLIGVYQVGNPSGPTEVTPSPPSNVRAE